MQPANLAICLAPNLLRPETVSIATALDTTKVNHVIEQLIVCPDLIPLDP